ncbi:MAG TPA: hypothetical protein VMY37_25720 [Thermoguttaceae bacterium]|nr:hypothetical protein [Thermoguttaceae bacterium]
MGIATREELFCALGRTKRRYRMITLPVSGLSVRIQSLTEGELSRYQRRLFAKGGRGFDPQRMQSANRDLFVRCLVDDAGNRQLSDDEAEKLTDMDAADASVLYEACAEHCGIDRTDLGDLSKNSETTSAAGSPSD